MSDVKPKKGWNEYNKGTVQQKYEWQRRNYSEEEFRKEMAFNLEMIYEVMDKNRKNTNHLVTWLILVPYIIGGLWLGFYVLPQIL